MIQRRCEAFFEGRKQINIPLDLKVLNSRILHEVVFGMKLTEKEAADFMALQLRILVLNGLPDGAAKNSAVRSALARS